LNADYLRIQLQTHRGIPRLNRVTMTQVMESRSSVLWSHSGSHWKYRKIRHESGLKFWPSLKRTIWMQVIFEFNYKLIEVPHFKIGLQ